MKNNHRFLILFFISLTAIYAQSISEKALSTVFSLQYIGNNKFSNSGDKFVFTLSTPNYDLNKFQTSIWIKDLANDLPATKITSVEANYSNLSFSADDKTINFLSSQNVNGTQVYSVSTSGGKVNQLTSFPNSVQRYSFAPDGNKIYFIAEDTLTIEERRAITDKRDEYYLEENKKVSSIYELDLKTKKRTKLTFGYNLRSLVLSKNGKYLCSTGTSTANASDEFTTEIYLYDLKNKTTRRLTRNSIIERQLVWGPNDEYILFLSSSNENLEPYYQESIFRINLNGDQLQDLLPSFPYQVIKFEFDYNSNTIFFIANKGLTQQLFQLDPKNNELTEITNVKGVIKDFIINSSKIVFQYSDPSTPDEFYSGNKNNKDFKKILNPNPIFDKSVLAKYQAIEWQSYDGTKIQGILILPQNLDRKKSYPMIVQLHGGPNSSYQLSFGSYWATFPHHLASLGYIIFQPNYRGSAGYGDNFMRGVVGNFFKLGTDDILSGIEFLISTGLADDSKLGLMGYSAGAHFTNWIISQSNIFKAAVSLAGMSNWLSFYSQTEVPYLRELWLNSNPYENADSWIQQSPIYYAKNITTPTLFISGELDRRVPFYQSIEMWRALKKYKVPTKLLIFPREYHSLEEVRNQYRYIKVCTDWLKTYINN